MRRLSLIALTLLLGAAALAGTARGDNEYTYYVEADNVFGIVTGSEVKISGVTQGVVDKLLINGEKRGVVVLTLNGPLAQLGQDSICSFEPQSLIAEYFIDCASKGAPLEPGSGSEEERANQPDIPVQQTRQTVQNDLVQSALRQPYKDRLRLLINEFGTALAGNPGELNEAILRGAPALTSTRKLTKILADQNSIIKNLNVNSDQIFAELAGNRKDVRRFVLEARDTAAISASRRDDLSQNFDLLDDFLVELRPTMSRLNEFAVAQTPLLTDLDRSADGLTTLSRNLPNFNRATTRSVTSLGDAAIIGRRALDKSRDEIDQLRRTAVNSFSVADLLAKFLRDIDDPSRAVEIDARANEDTGRKGPTGYTGMEGLLNYVYYQAGAINQFDEISHLLHFSIFEVGEGQCSSFNAGPTVPAQDGGETTDFNEIDRCVAWLGPNQPGINQEVDAPKYDPSVCPEGSTDLDICDPNGASTATAELPKKAAGATAVRGAAGAKGARGGSSGAGSAQSESGGGDSSGGGSIGDVPDAAAGVGGQAPSAGTSGAPGGASKDLLGFLLDD